MHATPWSLDEFPMVDTFADFADVPAPDAALPAIPAVSLEHLEADFAVRLSAERARIEADAYARGRADGERAARATLEETIAHTTSALNEAVLSVQMHEARWLSNAEENIAALSVLVARHVLQREILADRTFVCDLVTTAIEQYPIDEEITVRLHPDDLAACRPVLDRAPGAGVRTLRWLADTNIQRGGCLTEGRERIIDGRVDTSLERCLPHARGHPGVTVSMKTPVYNTALSDAESPLDALTDRLGRAERFAPYGRVTRVVGLVVEATGIDVGLGSLCRVTNHARDRSVLAEVVGFNERNVLLMPLGELDGLHAGASVQPLGRSFGVDVGPGLLGRVLNGLGHPIDGKGKLDTIERVSLSAEPPNPLQRETIDRPMETGVRAIDGLLTIGRGQRVGIFAGSGVGKTPCWAWWRALRKPM